MNLNKYFGEFDLVSQMVYGTDAMTNWVVEGEEVCVMSHSCPKMTGIIPTTGICRCSLLSSTFWSGQVKSSSAVWGAAMKGRWLNRAITNLDRYYLFAQSYQRHVTGTSCSLMCIKQSHCSIARLCSNSYTKWKYLLKIYDDDWAQLKYWQNHISLALRENTKSNHLHYQYTVVLLNNPINIRLHARVCHVPHEIVEQLK